MKLEASEKTESRPKAAGSEHPGVKADAEFSSPCNTAAMSIRGFGLKLRMRKPMAQSKPGLQIQALLVPSCSLLNTSRARAIRTLVFSSSKA